MWKTAPLCEIVLLSSETQMSSVYVHWKQQLTGELWGLDVSFLLSWRAEELMELYYSQSTHLLRNLCLKLFWTQNNTCSKQALQPQHRASVRSGCWLMSFVWIHCHKQAESAGGWGGGPDYNEVHCELQSACSSMKLEKKTQDKGRKGKQCKSPHNTCFSPIELLMMMLIIGQ